MAKKSIKEVSIEKIWADTSRNFRHSWKYRIEPKANFDAEKDVPGFYEDIVLNGIKTNIEVSLLNEEQRDSIEKKHGIRPTHRVIRGHRRFTAASIAHKANSAMFEKLTCVVYEGLSEKDEIALMYDDNGVEHLDEFEIYTAIKRLYGTGLSQERVASLIGQKRGYVQDRIYILEMPPIVEDNYRRRFTPVDGKPPVKGKDFAHVTFSDVDKLHKLWGADNAAKVPHDSAESQFLKLWTELTTATVPSPKGANTKALTKKEMDARAGYVNGCEALAEAHRFYNGEGGDLTAAKEMYETLENQAKKVPALESEVERLKEQVASLTALLDEKSEEIANLMEHIDSMTAVPTNGQSV